MDFGHHFHRINLFLRILLIPSNVKIGKGSINVGRTINHFPVENRKASIDCLEEQHKVKGNF